MREWIDCEIEEPVKFYGAAYEFRVEINSDSFSSNYFDVVGIWKGIDWYLLPFEEISGYQNTSGLEYFKFNKPKFWREYKASNIVY